MFQELFDSFDFDNRGGFLRSLFAFLATLFSGTLVDQA
jgi:hypothetical protein